MLKLLPTTAAIPALTPSPIHSRILLLLTTIMLMEWIDETALILLHLAVLIGG